MSSTQLLVDTGWSAQTRAEVAARLTHPGLGRWLGQVQQVRSCARPVRLVGATDTINTRTGEVLDSYTSTAEPDGVTYVRCGNRRASVCPSCSHEYKGDVWHVLMAGAAGGMKDVPDTVAAHPLVFATFTAPSFGLVHAAKKPGRPGSRRCLPRSGDRRQLCPHGRPRWCMAVHDHADPAAGQPLCGDCYDYAAHLVWQWWAPELWRRFTITLRRRLADHLGAVRVGDAGGWCGCSSRRSPSSSAAASSTFTPSSVSTVPRPMTTPTPPRRSRSPRRRWPTW